VAVTSARTPVLRGGWLAEGAHVSAVGSCTPEWREIDGEAVRRARVYVDSLAAAKQEAGDLIGAVRDGGWSFADVAGELGALFAGAVPGRRDAREITLFKSLGLACEDVATARWLIGRARERGVGRTIEL
jgi:alanine dehydrogenase